MKKRNQFIKRIGAFLCAVVVAVSCVGVASPYFAEETAYVLACRVRDINIYNGEGPETFPARCTNGQYKNYFLYYRGDGAWGCFFTNEDYFDLSYKIDTYPDGKAFCFTINYSKKEYVFSYTSDNGITWTDQTYPPMSLPGIYIDSGLPITEYCKFYISSCPARVDGQVFLNGNEGLIREKYNSALGYLQNLTTRTTWLTDNKGNADMNTTRTSVAFDLTTTTGIDLTSGDYVVRMYGQRAYFKNNFNDGFKNSYSGDILFDCDFPLVYFGEFNASSGKFVYDDDDLYSLIDVVDTERYSGWDLFVNQIHQGCIRYYQVYNTKTGEYGGYVRVINEGKDLQTTVRDDLSVDNGGFVDKDLNHSIGSGTTYEDAELNADKYQENIGDGNFSSLEGAVNSFTSTLGVVPQAIGSVFSFLPAWCYDYVGLCFGLLVTLVVWKLLRG